MLNIQKGSIVAVIEQEYIDFEGGKWSEHFAPKRKLYIALETPTNNGNFKAKNLQVNCHHLHETEVIEVITERS